MNDRRPVQNVLVLGATSAVATEVAKLYAARGARLHLVGRNADKLAEVVAACAPAEVTSQRADFSRLYECEAVVDAAYASLGRVDVALLAHGDLHDQLATERSFRDAERTLVANFTSFVALLIPLANRMEAARAGSIAVITSVAGDRGRPRNYTYGAAKGGLSTYLQGLRSRLYPSGVAVTTLKLGPVDTPMTVDHDKTRLFAKAPDVARDIVGAVDGRAAEVYVPSFWAAIMPIVKRTPERLFQRLPFLSGR